MRNRASLNIFSILQPPALQSITDIPTIGSHSKRLNKQTQNQRIQSTSYTEIQYQAFQLQSKKKIPQAILKWYKTLKFKKKNFKQIVPQQGELLARIACSQFIFYLSRKKFLKAYQLLGVLQKLTAKSKIKYPNKKVYRSRLLLQQILYSTGYYYLKNKKLNAALEFTLKGAELAATASSLLDQAIANILAGYISSRLSQHRLSYDLCQSTLELLMEHSDLFLFSTTEIKEQFVVLRLVTLYNFCVESLHLFFRADAEKLIDSAMEVAQEMEGHVLLKNKVVWLFEELAGDSIDVDPIEPMEPIQSPPETQNFNIMPGGHPEEVDNKLVELVGESQVPRKKRKKQKQK